MLINIGSEITSKNPSCRTDIERQRRINERNLLNVIYGVDYGAPSTVERQKEVGVFTNVM